MRRVLVYLLIFYSIEDFERLGIKSYDLTRDESDSLVSLAPSEAEVLSKGYEDEERCLIREFDFNLEPCSQFE